MKVPRTVARSAVALAAVLTLSSPALAQSTRPAATDVTIGSDSIHGMKVFDTDGKSLGSISRLMIGTDGRVQSVVIKYGATAGMGGKEMVVPWDALKVQRGEREQLIATMQRDVLEKAPAASPATEDSRKK